MLLKNKQGAGELAQQLRAFVALAEDHGSIPSTRMGLITICNSNDKQSDALH